jgi:hypothetical protein
MGQLVSKAKDQNSWCPMIKHIDEDLSPVTSNDRGQLEAASGKAFKDAVATIIAHKRAKERLELLKDPATPLPDETVDISRTITLGGTTLELNYVGPNHSDSTLVMRLPRDKIVFIVDLLPVGRMPGRGTSQRTSGARRNLWSINKSALNPLTHR